MKSYTARIAHTEQTIKTLMKNQDRLCHPILTLMGSTGCVVLVILALMLQPYIGKANTAIFSFIACLVFVNNRNRPIQLAQNILGKLQGKMPVINYSFSEDGVLVKREHSQQNIPYQEITGLGETATHCYFVYQKNSAFMFEKMTARDLKALKTLLAKKTGCKWVKLQKFIPKD